MFAKLAAPEQLELIEEVTLGCIIVKATTISFPGNCLHKVEVVVTSRLFSIRDSTCNRINISVLRFMIEVVDTTVVLYEHVIPRYQTRKLQSLGDE